MNAKDGAKLKLVEFYSSISTRNSMMGSIHEITSAKNSNLELDALHNENANTTCYPSAEQDGGRRKLKFNTFYNGSSRTRGRNVIEAAGRGSNVSVNEIVFGSGAQKFDINTFRYSIRKGEQCKP